MVSPMLYHSDGPEQFTRTADDTTSFVSFYFFGPDGEYLELAAQLKSFAPEADILHLPKRASDADA